jgi:general secretion pathway protein G
MAYMYAGLARRYLYGIFRGLNSRVSSERGFTLIELLIVVVVLGVLAAVVVFALGGINGQAAVAACQSDAKTVQMAVGAYEAQMGGDPPASLDVLTQGPNPYIQSLPSNSSYAISLANGVVMVAAPASATPMDANSAGACSGAGQGGATSTSSTTSTIPTSTTTTSTIPTSTTTTTTTTTIPPSNGVTAVGAYSTSGKKGSDVLTVSNTSEITELIVTIDVTSAPGETLSTPTEKFTYKSSIFSDSKASSGGELQYSYSLDSNKPTTDVIAANSQGALTATFTSSNLSAHSSAADTWSVDSVSNGVEVTLNGTF